MNCPHCNTHIDEHPANHCLNTWVAETVMDLEKYIFPGQDPKSLWDDRKIFDRLIEMGFTHKDAVGNKVRVPDYSGFIAIAWKVLGQFSKWRISAGGYVMLGNANDPREWTAHARKVPLAICRASIKAMMSPDVGC